MQRRFVSDVSHELRTPLTTVRMAGDVLHDARDGFDPATARAAELLQTRARPLRDAARRPAGDQPLRRRRRGARPRRRQPRRRGAPGRRHAPARSPTSAALEVVVRRPGHARASPRPTYAGSSGSCATWSPTRSTTPRAGEIVVTVGGRRAGRRDRGPRPRRRPASRGSRRWCSTGSGGPTRRAPAPAAAPGSGLSISLEDTHLHGGWLQAWGEPGEGAQFRLTLPRRAGDAAAPQPAAAGARRRRGGGRHEPSAADARRVAGPLLALTADWCCRRLRPAARRAGPVVVDAGQRRRARSVAGRLHAPAAAAAGRSPPDDRQGLPRRDDGDADPDQRGQEVPDQATRRRDWSPERQHDHLRRQPRRPAAGCEVSGRAARRPPARRPRRLARRPAAGRQTCSRFPMSQENGEWRIAAGPGRADRPGAWFEQRFQRRRRCTSSTRPRRSWCPSRCSCPEASSCPTLWSTGLLRGPRPDADPGLAQLHPARASTSALSVPVSRTASPTSP